MAATHALPDGDGERSSAWVTAELQSASFTLHPASKHGIPWYRMKWAYTLGKRARAQLQSVRDGSLPHLSVSPPHQEPRYWVVLRGRQIAGVSIGLFSQTHTKVTHTGFTFEISYGYDKHVVARDGDAVEAIFNGFPSRVEAWCYTNGAGVMLDDLPDWTGTFLIESDGSVQVLRDHRVL